MLEDVANIKQPPTLPFASIPLIANAINWVLLLVYHWLLPTPTVQLLKKIVNSTIFFINSSWCKWSEFVQAGNTIYHCDPDINSILKNLSLSTAEYKQYTTTLLTGFFDVNKWSLAPKAKLMVDCRMRQIPRFFLLCRGTRTPDKNDVVNACVLVFGFSLNKKKFSDVDVFNIPK
jgi:hypothetical protein